jgi:hypothetical protein
MVAHRQWLGLPAKVHAPTLGHDIDKLSRALRRVHGT